MSKIGIFGGSFDPPTNSHLYVGEDLLEKGYLDAVWYLPCYNSLHGKNVTNGDIRLNMIERLICKSRFNNEISKRDGLSVCEFEIQNKMTGRSLDVITKMFAYYRTNGYADDEFYMIIGMDNAKNIHKFAEWKQVIAMAPFIVLNRKGCESTQTWFKEKPHIFANDINVPEMSSTMIRDAVMVMTEKGLQKNFLIGVQ